MDLLCAELEQFKELLKAEGVGEETSSVFTLLHCTPPGAAQWAGGQEGETDTGGESFCIGGTAGDPLFALARRLPAHSPFYFPLIWFKLCHEGAVHVGQPVEANAAHRLQAQVLALPGCKAFWVEKASIVPHPRVQGLPLPHCAPLHARAAPDQHLLEVQVAA